MSVTEMAVEHDFSATFVDSTGCERLRLSKYRGVTAIFFIPSEDNRMANNSHGLRKTMMTSVKMNEAKLMVDPRLIDWRIKIVILAYFKDSS